MVGYQREQMIKYWGFASARCLGLKYQPRTSLKKRLRVRQNACDDLMIMSVRITAPPRLTF